MATYIIYKDDNEINRIAANEDYAKMYCQDHGYTYKLEEFQDLLELNSEETPNAAI